MILAEEDAAMFYRAWGALLTWVNDRRNIVPRFPRPMPGYPLEPELTSQIRDVLWADDALREQFLTEAPLDLAAAERDLIASWKDRSAGSFFIFRHLKKHSIFMSDAVYAVRGIYTPLEVLCPHVPMMVEAVLLPFRDVIITDGTMKSPPMHLSFGGGVRRMFNNQYRAARNGSQIRTRLPWETDPTPPESPLSAQPSSEARRPPRGARRS